MFDVIIVGGSTAGLTAALILGRFRRRVLVLDTGKPANRFSHASHNFFTRDGVPASELLAIAREQLTPYTSVEYRAVGATGIAQEGEHFTVSLADGTQAQSRKVLLATGLKDSLESLEGAAEFWGHGIYHCPYCDGWEQRDKAIAIIADNTPSPRWPLLAKVLRQLSADVTLCTNGYGDVALTAQDRDSLARYQIKVIDTPVRAVIGEAGVLQALQLEDGQQVPCESVFTHPENTQHSTLAATLGCELTEQGFVSIDAQGQTSITGVYAAGDMTTPMRQLVQASYQGATAAASINMALIMEDFI